MISPSSTRTSSTFTMTLSSSKTSRRRSPSRVRRTSTWQRRSIRGPCSPCRPTGCLHCSFISPSSSHTGLHVSACCRISRADYEKCCSVVQKKGCYAFQEEKGGWIEKKKLKIVASCFQSDQQCQLLLRCHKLIVTFLGQGELYGCVAKKGSRNFWNVILWFDIP